MSDLGHNNPPPAEPIEEARETLASLETEANAWFDGTPIENQAQADDVARLLDAARKLKTKSDGERKAEKKPHDDAAKAVDAKWKPILTAADRVAEIAKAAQTVWLVKLDREKREREEAARKEAEVKAAEACRLAAEADGSLAAAKARDAAIEEAKRAEAAAQRAANDKAGAKGIGMARTVSLRTTYRSEVKDRRELLKHVLLTAPDEITEWLEDWAAKAVRNGARELPGVEIWQEKAAA